MNKNKMLLPMFIVSFMSASLLSMDDISRCARQYQMIDEKMNYSIVDKGPRNDRPTSCLGMMQAVQNKKAQEQYLQLQRIQLKYQKIAEKKEAFFKKLDPQLAAKLKNNVTDDQEDYHPLELKSNLFFLHVTTEASKLRETCLNNVSTQVSPTKVSSNKILSPRGILKKNQQNQGKNN